MFLVLSAWIDFSISARRRVAVDGMSISAELEWTAAGPRAAPLVVVEHVALGPVLLDPEIEILAHADARELSPTDSPDQRDTDVTRWPSLRLLDGSIESAGRWPFEVPRGRLAALTGFTRGRAEIRNLGRDVGVRLEWSARTLPAAWVWHEVRHRGGLWDQRAELLGFEPASVPHAMGLAEALTAGHAIWARPGRRDGYRISLTVIDGRRRRLADGSMSGRVPQRSDRRNTKFGVAGRHVSSPDASPRLAAPDRRGRCTWHPGCVCADRRDPLLRSGLSAPASLTHRCEECG